MRCSGQAIGGVLASAQASVGRGVKRDFNQWADKLTHPDCQGFSPDRRLSASRC